MLNLLKKELLITNENFDSISNINTNLQLYKKFLNIKREKRYQNKYFIRVADTEEYTILTNISY